MIVAPTLRIGLLGFGHHPDLFTHWFDFWIVGVGFTFTKSHPDSRKLKDALRRIHGSGEQ